MKTFKDSIKLFKYNRSSIIVFEIIYKLLTAAFMAPILYSILNFSVKAAGIKYLMPGTEKLYFRAPTTYILLIVILLIVAMMVMINISGIIYAMEASHRGEKTTPLILLVKGIVNSARVVNMKNFLIVPYILLILPFTYTIMISGTLMINKIPEFITRTIMRNKIALICAFIVYIVLCMFAIYRIFALNYYSIYRMNFSKAVKISKEVVGKNVWRVVIGVVIWNVAFTLLLVLTGGAITTIAASFIGKIISWKKARFILNWIIKISFMVIYLILSIISTPLIYSYICTCFYRFDGDDAYEEFIDVKRKRKKKDLSPKQIKIRNNISIIILLIIGLVADAAYIYLSVNDKIDFNVLYPTSASVTAHRGDSQNAPENTMAAFRLAVENQADIIELDVRETKDGRYIIMHDESLSRTTGEHYKVGEVTYNYIKTLDAGSWFSDEYKGEQVPSLDEVLQFASENDIYLNIELKAADTDKDYVDGLIELIDEYNYRDKCMLGSDVYKLLREIKQKAPDIKTLYIMHMALGEIGDMTDVDVFSIKYSFISSDIVKNVHKYGKDIYAWTVDNEEQIKRLLLINVDGIITDDPYNTKKIVYNANSGILIDILARMSETGL